MRNIKLDEYTQIDQKWRLVWDIVNNPQQGRYLQNADLSDADLRNADLRNADLRSANLIDADLDQIKTNGHTKMKIEE